MLERILNKPRTTTIFERSRFGPEAALLGQLQSRFGLDDLIDHIVESGQLRPFHHYVMAQYLRLTPVLAPRVFNVLNTVRSRLDFDEPVDLYVHPNNVINALAMHRPASGDPHLIALSSELVRSMTDEEMAFALGHEIGHLAMGHARIGAIELAIGQDGAESEAGRRSPVPPLVQRRLEKWQRLTEISADRIGFLASGRELTVAVSCFFKAASGLGAEHVRFDIAAFLEQLRDLQQLEQSDVLARFSHPATPVRARAIQLYSEAGGPDAAPDCIERLDREIEALARLMDFEASTDLGRHVREFLVTGGLLAAYADGDISEDEQSALIQLLLQVTGDPESHLQQITDRDEAERRLADACDWLNQHSGQERYGLFGQLAHIVALDGVITRGERKFMTNVADMLGIPGKAAREILHEVLSSYVRSSSSKTKARFGFRAASEDAA